MTSDVELSKEIWNELKRHINSLDRADAAETLVSVLIDNDIDADSIKSAFKSEPEVKAALASYLNDHADNEDDDDEDYDELDEDYDDESDY